jgi:spore germination cell wall hydrolase CwlJ-like protein
MNYRTLEVVAYLIIMLVAFTCISRGQSPSDIVAATLILEAGGEYSMGSMEAVHEVIINRSLKRSLTPWDICLEYKQFSCWNTMGLATGIAIAQKHPRWRSAKMIVASKVTSYTLGADHYHADYCEPYWAKHMTMTVVIGRHVFYR